MGKQLIKLWFLVIFAVFSFGCEKQNEIEDEQDLDRNSDLVAWYSLDGGNGDDLSENRNKGTAYDVQSVANRKGVSGSASYFNGISSYIEIPDRDYLSIANKKQLSISIWMKPEVLDFPSTEREDYVHWLGKGTTGQHEYTFRIYDRNSYRPNRISGYAFNLEGGLGAGMYFEEELIEEEWVHVVVVYDYPKNSILIYRDGKFKGASTFSSYKITPRDGTAPLRIGTRDFASYFKGALDDLKIYNRVLSEREIIALFNE